MFSYPPIVFSFKDSPHYKMALAGVVVLLSLGAMALSLGFLHAAADRMPSAAIQARSWLSYDSHFVLRDVARLMVVLFIAASAVLAHFAARLGQFLHQRFKRL